MHLQERWNGDCLPRLRAFDILGEYIWHYKAFNLLGRKICDFGTPDTFVGNGDKDAGQNTIELWRSPLVKNVWPSKNCNRQDHHNLQWIRWMRRSTIMMNWTLTMQNVIKVLLVEFLLLATKTWPDIVSAVSVLGTHVFYSEQKHLHATRRVLKYL